MLGYKTQKQIVIGLTTILVVIVLVFLGKNIFKPQPTCFDNKQNQNEDAIDCGGSCLACDLKDLKPLVVENTYILDYKLKGPDLVTKVFNPNTKYGLSEIAGHFTLTNSQGVTLTINLDEPFYILPGEEKLITKTKALAENTNFIPTSVRFDIDSKISFTDWQKLPAAVSSTGEVLQLIGLKMKYTDAKKASPISITADLVNRSTLNYKRAFVDIMLCDKKTGNPISFNQIYLENIKTEEIGIPTMTWRQSLPLGATVCYSKAHTNVFSLDNRY
jgi:hypothetical protein